MPIPELPSRAEVRCRRMTMRWLMRAPRRVDGTVTGWLRVALLLPLLSGCAGGVRGAASVAVSVKACPEVAQLASSAATDWQGSLGIDAGDAETLKSALEASKSLYQDAQDLEARLKSACDGLTKDLGEPVVPGTTEQACERASSLLERQKGRLGSGAAAVTATPAGAEGASPPAAAPPADGADPAPNVESIDSARYRAAVQRFSAALLVVGDVASNMKGALGSTRRAVELGMVTGQSVSAGDIASAAAAVACLLPPLLEAKRRFGRLRQDFALLAKLARMLGLKLPQTPTVEEPVVAHTTVGRGAPPTVAAPIDGRVHRLFTFPEGGFAAQTERGVVALPGGQPLLRFHRGAGPRGVRIELGISGGGRSRPLCAVGAGRHVVCLRSSPVFANNRYAGAELVLDDSAAGLRAVARVGERGQLLPAGVAFDAAGQLRYAYTLSDVQGDARVEYTRVNRGGAELQLPFNPTHDSVEQLGGGGRQDAALQFVSFRGRELLLYRDGRQLLLAPLEQPGAAVELAKLSAYDARAVVGGDGVLYVFYYEPKSRTARVTSSKDGVHFESRVLDGRESGWQLEAIASPDGAIAVFYYFRNSYNKGLRTAALHDGKLKRSPLSLVREDRWDAGWHPLLVADATQQVWLTYLSHVELGTRVWSRFDTPSNLLDYSMAPLGNDEDEYKDWFVQAGAGGWYTWWGLKSPAPEASEVDGAVLQPASYAVKPALLLSANVEARVGPINVGLSYAQNYLDEAAKKLGEVNRMLSGSLKIEDLLPGHDIKAEGVWGRYSGRATRAVSGAASEELTLDTSYLDVHLLALNQWRVKYGLAFNRFTVPTPVMVYTAGESQTQYAFAASALRNVTYNNIALAIGYSKLDYLAKYENRYFGPILDATLSGGISLASFEPIVTPVESVDSEAAWHGRLNVRLGWLWMERSRSLSGLGFYLRPAYTAEGGVITNGLARPDDREAKDAEKAATDASFLLYTLRHGPWLDAGVIW
jgi:hypothetical protein